MSTHKINESLVADDPTSKAGRSGLLHNISAFKTKHPPQHKISIMDDPVLETEESAIT
jgi:hypothetical protein